jgi:nucleotide-binding universal stress UspA family protein
MAQYKILIPLDGSRLAEHSLVYLDAVRSMGDSQVLLFSVIDDAEALYKISPREAYDRERNLLSTYLREVAGDISKHLGIEVDTKVVAGSPAERILEEAAKYSPNLLVVSTHGRSGFSRWRLGSVADKVIRGAACNTMVVGPKATEHEIWLDARIVEPFKRLLVPLDGSVLAESALPIASSFANTYGAQVHLVRVVSIPATGVGVGEAAFTPDLVDSLVEGASSYLEGTLAKFELDDAKTDVLVGGAAWRLADYIAENSIDLVVMTSHGRSGFLRTALGSVTDRLLGGAAPVLVVRPQE